MPTALSRHCLFLLSIPLYGIDWVYVRGFDRLSLTSKGVSKIQR